MRKVKVSAQNKIHYVIGMLLASSTVAGGISTLLSLWLWQPAFTENRWSDLSQLMILSLASLYFFDHFWTKYRKWSKCDKEARENVWLEQRRQDRITLTRFLEDLTARPKEEIIDSLKSLGMITPNGELSHKILNVQMDPEKAVLLISLISKFAAELTGEKPTVLFLSIAKLLVREANGTKDYQKAIEGSLEKISEKDKGAATAIRTQIPTAEKTFRAPWEDRKKEAIQIAHEIL